MVCFLTRPDSAKSRPPPFMQENDLAPVAGTCLPSEPKQQMTSGLDSLLTSSAG